MMIARLITGKAEQMLSWGQEGTWGQSLQQHPISYRLRLIVTMHPLTTVQRRDELPFFIASFPLLTEKGI